MANDFSLPLHTVHIWFAKLPDFQGSLAEYSKLLSPDEIKRAERFRFPIHRERFILARGILRSLLSQYIKILPENIVFEYGKKGKPFLKKNPDDIQFNVSHSDDIALYAVTKKFEIGVDIEKMDLYKNDVAKRFFAADEYEALKALPESEKRDAFYRVWAKKEALMKAVGEGLSISLDAFSVSVSEKIQTISLQDKTYHLEMISVHPDYQAAFATEQSIKNCLVRNFG
jgi:4'-phosphopantetheinyl transferase